MDSREKKVCVAVGNEREEGFKTLKWAIQKWKVHPLSIIILHVRNNAAKDTVKTPCKFKYLELNYFHFFCLIHRIIEEKFCFKLTFRFKNNYLDIFVSCDSRFLFLMQLGRCPQAL